MKNPLTPAGIEPATFRFVAQHLNHCATAVPYYYCNYYYYYYYYYYSVIQFLEPNRSFTLKMDSGVRKGLFYRSQLIMDTQKLLHFVVLCFNMLICFMKFPDNAVPSC